MDFGASLCNIGIIILTLTLICCKPSKTKDIAIDCERLIEMGKQDQYYRNDQKAIPYLYVSDSLFYMENGYRVKHSDMPMTYIKRASQIVKGRPASNFVDLKYSDSIINLMATTDKELALELIDIIQMHDDSVLYNSECFRQALLIFVHAPSELFQKVDDILIKHRAAIPDPNYNHIMRTFKHFGYKKPDGK